MRRRWSGWGGWRNTRAPPGLSWGCASLQRQPGRRLRRHLDRKARSPRRSGELQGVRPRQGSPCCRNERLFEGGMSLRLPRHVERVLVSWWVWGLSRQYLFRRNRRRSLARRTFWTSCRRVRASRRAVLRWRTAEVRTRRASLCVPSVEGRGKESFWYPGWALAWRPRGWALGVRSGRSSFAVRGDQSDQRGER